jgi:hypothetical protein
MAVQQTRYWPTARRASTVFKTHNERKTMKNSVIDIVQRFQTHHALQEERELNSHASRNGAVPPSVPDNNGIPENTIFESEDLRISTVTLPARNGQRRVIAGIDWSLGWAK